MIVKTSIINKRYSKLNIWSIEMPNTPYLKRTHKQKAISLK